MELRKEVFAWYGGAAYYAQCFEVELGILLVLCSRVKHGDMSGRELDDLEEWMSKKTLGALLRELEKHVEISSDFRELLEGYRDKRNYLVHQFFFAHSADMMNRDGCSRMIEELKELSQEFQAADRIASTMHERMRQIAGVDEDALQRYVTDLLQEYRS